MILSFDVKNKIILTVFIISFSISSAFTLRMPSQENDPKRNVNKVSSNT